LTPSRRRKRQDKGGPAVRIWCTTPVEAAGRDLEAFTTSLNSSKKSRHQREEEGGEAAAAEGEEEGEDEGDGGAGPPTAATVAKD